jgi:hypothetical protein
MCINIVCKMDMFFVINSITHSISHGGKLSFQINGTRYLEGLEKENVGVP